MAFVTALRCKECGRETPVEPTHVCDFCFGPLGPVYDYDSVARVISRERIEKGPLSLWRYQDLLPVDGPQSNELAVDLNAGFTPLIKAKNLGELLGLDNLYIKNDSVNPSFSFKDRVVTVAATKAREFGFETLACASTGNLACAVAAHAARGGMKSVVFIPADLEYGKIIGAAIYGPIVIAVDGNYDDVNRLCSEAADTYPWAFVNINMRPYYAEGSKTLAYEVAEQLGLESAPACNCPLRLRLPVHQDMAGIQRDGGPGPDRDAVSPQHAPHPGRRLLTHSGGVQQRSGHRQASSARHP